MDNFYNSVKRESLEFVKSTFETAEQLENIELILDREIKNEKDNEKMLQELLNEHIKKIMSCSNDLKLASVEAGFLESNMSEMKTICDNFKQMEPDLENLIKCSKTVSATTQAVKLLHQLLNIGENIENTNKLIDELNLLNAHKNLREFEGVRDKIYAKYINTSETGADTKSNINSLPFAKNFEEINILNQKLLQKIKSIYSQIPSYAEDDPVTLVTVNRIVMRETVIDEYWKKALTTKTSLDSSYIPSDRPKDWLSVLRPTVKESIQAKIDSLCVGIDFVNDKHGVTEFLTKIEKYTMNCLKTIQSDAIRCFPPSINIMEIFCLNFHEIIREVVGKISKDWDSETRGTELIGLLMFEKEYYGSDLFGNSFFKPPILNIIKKCPPIINPSTKSNIEKLFISRIFNLLDKKVFKIVKMEYQLWTGEQPPLIIDGHYFTFTYTFYNDFVGVHLSSVSSGSISSELHWGVFKPCITAFETFVNKYAESLDEYIVSNFPTQNLQSSSNALSTFTSMINPDKAALSQQRPAQNISPHFASYCMAIANNTKEVSSALKKSCDQFVSDFRKRDEMKYRCEGQSDETILGKNTLSRIASINDVLNDIGQKCTIGICNDFIRDLGSAFDELFSKNWREKANDWSLGFHSAIEGFSETLNHLKQEFRVETLKKTDFKLAYKYLNLFFGQKNKYSKSSLSTFGDIIFNDGKFMSNYFSTALEIDAKKTWTYAICLCANAFKASDYTCATIDLFSLFKEYSDFTEDHAGILLRIRGDFNKDTIRNIISESVANINKNEKGESGLFCLIKKSDKKSLTPLMH